MKKLNQNKIIYITSISENSQSGPCNKIMGLLQAADSLGYETEAFFKGSSSIFSLFFMFIRTDACYIIYRRFAGWIELFLPFFLLVARLQGKKIIVDVPSPIKTHIQEILKGKGSLLKKYRHIFYVLLVGPIPFWFVNRIVEYAEEGDFFLLGCKSKVVLLGNGIDCNRIALRKKEYLNNKQLILVGVAQVASYHGYDKIIRAIAEWKKEDRSYDIIFHLIGGSGLPIIEDLKLLANDLGVADFVVFHGLQGKEYIEHYYAMSDLAVGSLAFHRINLFMASPLKIREYALAGIPFITSDYVDPDFPKDLPFNFVVSNDDNINDILSVFEIFYEVRKTFRDDEIRQYCIDNAAFVGKIKKMIS